MTNSSCQVPHTPIVILWPYQHLKYSPLRHHSQPSVGLSARPCYVVHVEERAAWKSFGHHGQDLLRTSHPICPKRPSALQFRDLAQNRADLHSHQLTLNLRARFHVNWWEGNTKEQDTCKSLGLKFRVVNINMQKQAKASLSCPERSPPNRDLHPT